MTTPYQSPGSNLNHAGMTSCKGCGKDIHSTAAACPHCGFSRRSSRYKSKTIAALFALFLGGFGAHRFYLGQWWGVLYLLLFWLWIPGIISLIEFIYFLVCDTKKWDNKYNEGIPAGPTDKSSGALVALFVIIGAFIFVTIIGILAAIALPAYQDYTVRAKVSRALLEAAPLKSKVEEYYLRQGHLPQANVDLTLDDPHIISGGNTVTITPAGLRIDFKEQPQNLTSKTLVLTPVEVQPSITWQCFGGTLESKYRPLICRK